MVNQLEQIEKLINSVKKANEILKSKGKAVTKLPIPEIKRQLLANLDKHLPPNGGFPNDTNGEKKKRLLDKINKLGNLLQITDEDIEYSVNNNDKIKDDKKSKIKKQLKQWRKDNASDKS